MKNYEQSLTCTSDGISNRISNNFSSIESNEICAVICHLDYNCYWYAFDNSTRMCYTGFFYYQVTTSDLPENMTVIFEKGLTFSYSRA